MALSSIFQVEYVSFVGWVPHVSVAGFVIAVHGDEEPLLIKFEHDGGSHGKPLVTAGTLQKAGPGDPGLREDVTIIARSVC